jgi:hypothetical protein
MVNGVCPVDAVHPAVILLIIRSITIDTRSDPVDVFTVILVISEEISSFPKIPPKSEICRCII